MLQVQELNSKRPLIPADLALPSAQQEVLDTFRTAAALGARALGAYVISMASSPSDVLAAVLLQKTMAVAVRRCAPVAALACFCAFQQLWRMLRTCAAASGYRGTPTRAAAPCM
jgi:phosphoenolpyruvate carboxylase